MIKKFFNKIIDRFRSLPCIRKNPSVKEIIKYSIVGNFTSILDFALYIYLTRFFPFWKEHYLTANFFAILIDSVIRFILHKKWTFRNEGKNIHTQYLKFTIVCLLIMLTGEVLLYTAVEYFGIGDVLGKLISSVIITMFAFLSTKLWVFGRSKEKHIEKYTGQNLKI
ncbi:hypothetical protein COV56_02055 [Candidatus Kuenenbacteria bacterium CG11_big_fil_rev_8_21_14_0_20_37_9]|uniref:GtrA/DPMS transmembrane domain-containing protein n=2 Tax=Candidatus Kueneniibacteriota TaxID=1752740 RepID=A0A2M6XSN2_9BACT|nr:MAG: hypothetical protein AUJ29_03255 [Candidatus Kuenenbacteria bacterium CG1_02_38_13]PIR05550.1 MAG: hypothetical protein COV56_02055 [Candidatus Kuenenbacteria bacterium CG11_big_fil_rev_8_21_14_0_20_37_9]PIU10655.1 MAG: hypothetical protein COT27_01855 [Candidatus Kuenenbacteria bacterium CG08_land_8_20_14_0_20_37_23]